MGDKFTARIYSLAVVITALATVGAVIYLSVSERRVNEYLAGLAGLTMGALLPSPMQARTAQGSAKVAPPATTEVAAEPGRAS